MRSTLALLSADRIRFAAVVLACSGILSSGAYAITVDIDGVAWPTALDPNVEVATSFNVGNFAFQDNGPFPLAQTFQVDSTFDLNSVFINYGSSSDTSVGIQIFEVADVNSPSLVAGTLLFDDVFTAPTAGDNTVMQFFLDAPLSLPSTSGTAGYALQFTNDDSAFEWDRTGSSANNVYAFGTGYDGGTAISGTGGRDLALALSTEVAPPPPVDVLSVQSGGLNVGTTWDNGLAPAPGFNYIIVNSDNVAATSTSFAGDSVVVQSGTLDLQVSGVDIADIEVQAGGVLTSSTGAAVGGGFALGDINLPNLNNVKLDGVANFAAASPGDDLFVDVDLTGSGELNFESNGAGSVMFLTAAGSFGGVIRFNGTGDEVLLVEDQDFGSTLEMNSTGANRLVYEATAQLDGGAVVFNQPGEIVHAQTNTNFSRIQGPGAIEANADVTVDLSIPRAGNERRMFMAGGIRGAGNITVNGTATDPTSGSITFNEFETGSTGEPNSLGVDDDFTGTLTGNDHVAIELRRSLPNGRVVINNNAQLEMGHNAVASAFSVAIGEIEVNSGGTLIVGYEQDDEHNSYQLTLTSEGSRNGDLTLASGSTTVMQINGTADGEFDSIVAEGDVSLGGTLEILISPDGAASGANPIYSPTLGDTFDLIVAASSAAVGDYDSSGVVDGGDFDAWASEFGSAGPGADGNVDGSVSAADFAIWRNSIGGAGSVGSITGAFDSLAVNDPTGILSTAGLALQLNVSSTLVQLEVVAAAPAVFAAVPEPTSLSLLTLTAFGLLARRKW